MKESEKARVQTNRCCHNIDLEARAQTFMLHSRLSPLCASASVKRSPHWSCDESQKNALLRRSRFVSCVRTQVHIWTACLFVRTCLHVTYTNKNLGNERVTTFLSTQVHEACAHS
jgi:hypothetical protein